MTKVLHVINDVSIEMKYGGPAMNCLRHSEFLEKSGIEISVWGTYTSKPMQYQGKNAYFLQNYDLLKVKRFVFQFSPRNILVLFKLINHVDIVHVHFAREINPVIACLITILKRKKLVLQTHGMIVKDSKLEKQFWDLIFTNYIFSKANIVLPLQEDELLNLQKFPIGKFAILPNGISLQDESFIESERKSIVFISRLHERKKPNLFIDSAILIERKSTSEIFEIYGEDAGALQSMNIYLENSGRSDWYKGGLEHAEVLKKLSKSKLLILPSEKEPFPMIILESLVAGTPVIAMSDSGIAQQLALLDPLFVTQPNAEMIANNAFQILKKYSSTESRISLSKKAFTIFSIDEVVSKLIDIYNDTLEENLDA